MTAFKFTSSIPFFRINYFKTPSTWWPSTSKFEDL